MMGRRQPWPAAPPPRRFGAGTARGGLESLPGMAGGNDFNGIAAGRHRAEQFLEPL
jgi:hypothetical protein